MSHESAGQGSCAFSLTTSHSSFPQNAGNLQQRDTKPWINVETFFVHKEPGALPATNLATRIKAFQADVWTTS
jgi:hypothetical protein